MLINLTNYEGDTVVFRMEFRSDQAITSNIFVDDFCIFSGTHCYQPEEPPTETPP